MAVRLTKGTNTELRKLAPNLKRILIGLGWEARATRGAAFDLDASIFCLGAQGMVPSDDYFVFYHQLSSPCGSIKHTGDERVGAKEGDDEAITIELDRVPTTIQKMAVAVTIYDGEALRQNFGQVSQAFMRIVDLDTDTELARFDLSEDYSSETAMIFGEVYRHNGEWKFKAVGQGMTGGLEALCRQFGVSVG